MHPILKESLKAQDICPVCGFNWVEAEKSLHEGIDSDNCLLAIFTIRSCEAGVCQERFKDEIV